MNNYYYDLHLHSCLSPCGDDDMTPNNIAGMATLNGLQIVALTDHNSAKNCRAFYAACKKQGVIPIAGMELTTAEDIHLVCLFHSCEDAEAFDDALQIHRTPLKNRVDVFGRQPIMNGEDEVIGEEENFLPIATDLPIADAVRLARAGGAVVFPAHIDREANGIIATLAAIPEELGFHVVEFRDRANVDAYTKQYHLEGKRVLVDSDAHYLWDINTAENFATLDDDEYSGDLIRKRFFEWLESEE